MYLCTSGQTSTLNVTVNYRALYSPLTLALLYVICVYVWWTLSTYFYVHILEVKNFLSKLSVSREGPVKSTETWQEWKHKKTILLQKSGDEERLEDYSTSVAKIMSGNRSRVVFQSFFTPTFLQQDSFLVFSSLSCFCTFSGPSLLAFNFYGKFYS